jgi:hypothetical protein
MKDLIKTMKLVLVCDRNKDWKLITENMADWTIFDLACWLIDAERLDKRRRAFKLRGSS